MGKFVFREGEQYRMGAEVQYFYINRVLCRQPFPAKPRCLICVSTVKWSWQISVTFSDFEEMERVCCVLLEKLDKSVCVGMPQFYHSPECLSEVRYLKKKTPPELHYKI